MFKLHVLVSVHRDDITDASLGYVFYSYIFSQSCISFVLGKLLTDICLIPVKF